MTGDPDRRPEGPCGSTCDRYPHTPDSTDPHTSWCTYCGACICPPAKRPPLPPPEPVNDRRAGSSRFLTHLYNRLVPLRPTATGL